MQKPGLREFMQGIYKLEEAQNLRCTMLGIGPMSENLIEACFLLAKKKDFPVMFIASRNQVDADEFGGGYVCSWNQDTFRRDIAKIAGAAGTTGSITSAATTAARGSGTRSAATSCRWPRRWSWASAPICTTSRRASTCCTSTPPRSPTWATWSRWTWCSTSRSS